MAAMQCSSGVSTSWHVRGDRTISARTSSIMPSHGACCQQIPSNKKRCVVALLGQLRPSDSFLGSQRGFKIKETRRRTDRGLENGKVSAEGSALEKVVDVAVKTGKRGLKVATELIPESVPRPVATVGVGVVSLLVFSTVVKAIFNTALSIAVIGAVGYVAFIYVSKDDKGGGGGGGGSDKGDDPLDEARRIMDKYK